MSRRDRLEWVPNTARRLRLIYRINFKGFGLARQVRVAGRIGARKLLRPGAPLWAMIGLTYRCQCRCVHCGMGEYGRRVGEELSIRELFSVIDQIAAMGAVKIVFFGGEPLCRDDTASVIEYAASMGLITSLDTNGALLTRAMALSLKAAGLKSVQVSLDSADPARHEELRGRSGLFEEARRAIESSLEAGLCCVISTYASKQALRRGDLADIISLGRAWGVDAVRIVQPIASGRWLDSREVPLDAEEEARLAALVDRGFVYTDDQKGAYRECASIRREFFYISPLGDFQPCCYIPLTFGNVRRERVGELWQRMLRHPLYRMERGVCPMNNAAFRSRFIDPIPRDVEWPYPVDRIGEGESILTLTEAQ